MSNYTDGKKALGDGDFALAEKKLLKALDSRPDDSELWWAIMLAKLRFRSDAELADGVKAKFAEAAERGEPPPPTPFETTYAMNAFRFAATSKRRDFAYALYAELSDIWKEKRGKPLKPLKLKIKTDGAQNGFLKVATYVSIGLAAVGGAVGLIGLCLDVKWAVWVGFILLMLFVLTSAGLRFIVKRDSAAPKGTLWMIFGLVIAVAIALAVIGLVTVNRTAVTVATVALVILALVGSFALAYRKRAGANAGNKSKARSKNTAKPSSRDPEVLMRSGSGGDDKGRRKNASGRDEKKDEVKGNGYEDRFD